MAVAPLVAATAVDAATGLVTRPATSALVTSTAADDLARRNFIRLPPLLALIGHGSLIRSFRWVPVLTSRRRFAALGPVPAVAPSLAAKKYGPAVPIPSTPATSLERVTVRAHAGHLRRVRCHEHRYFGNRGIEGCGTSLAVEPGSPHGAGSRPTRKKGRSGRKVQVIVHRSSSCPLTQFTRIVPLVLQSFKTTIVNIV